MSESTIYIAGHVLYFLAVLETCKDEKKCLQWRFNGVLQRDGHLWRFCRFQENLLPTWTTKCDVNTLCWMPESTIYTAGPVVSLSAVLGICKNDYKLAPMAVTRACSRDMAIFDVLVVWKRTHWRPEQSNVMLILYVGSLKARYIHLAQ